MPTKARIVKEHRQATMRKHGYTRCPDCAFKLAWPFDERCPECNCPFWPKAGHYSEQEAAKRAAKQAQNKAAKRGRRGKSNG